MRLTFGIATLAVAGTMAFTSTALADDTVVVQPAPQPVVVQQPATTTYVTPATTTTTAETRSDYVGPNRGLIATGLVTFGISYGASAIVAGTSTHQGDQHLYVPVVGPWLDIADRGSCGPALTTSCDGETTSKVLLVFDGIFQGVGVLSVIGGLVMPETRTVATTETAKARVRVTPTTYGRGAPGLALIGQF